ncbi:MAG: TraM recognition domain-containing protein, partial [Candidatus Nanohaloarchaea archaeon]
IFVDEVHRIVFANSSDDQMAFGDIITDARGHGVRFMVASQSLNRFSNKTGRTVLGNCQMQIFLQIDDMAKGFYRYYNFPWQEMKKEINGVDYAGVRYASGEFSEPFKLKA